MKNLKKTIALIAAAMTLTASAAIPVQQVSAAVSESGGYTPSKITNLSTLHDKILNGLLGEQPDELYPTNVEYDWENNLMIIHYFYKYPEIIKLVTDYANENNIDTNVIKFVADDKYTALDRMQYRLYDFVNDNKLRAHIHTELSDENGTSYILVNYPADSPDVREKAEQFLNEKGCDTANVRFLETSFSEPGELITDPYEICWLISDFAKEKYGWASVGMEYNCKDHYDENGNFLFYESVPASVSVCVNWYDEKKITAAIDQFAEEKNIDKSLVTYMILEGGAEPEISCDVNDDGKTNIRDAAFIARHLSQGRTAELPDCADVNRDGKKDVRDAAALAESLAKDVLILE